MEADRGQADMATVLSVGVHTSPLCWPRPRPHHTHIDSYLSDGGSDPGVARSGSCSPAVVWDPDLRGVS